MKKLLATLIISSFSCGAFAKDLNLTMNTFNGNPIFIITTMAYSMTTDASITCQVTAKIAQFTVSNDVRTWGRGKIYPNFNGQGTQTYSLMSHNESSQIIQIKFTGSRSDLDGPGFQLSTGIFINSGNITLNSCSTTGLEPAVSSPYSTIPWQNN